MSLTDLDKRIIHKLQEDLPLSPQPYLEIAMALNIREEELLDKINTLLKEGTIRRLGGALRHREMGFKANAMIVWRVEEARASAVGEIIGRFSEVSHCYGRKTSPQWPYNIFSMVHGGNHQECEEIAERISKAAGVADYLLLFSSRELKKTSMRYFIS